MGGYNRPYPSLGWVGVDGEQIVWKNGSCDAQSKVWLSFVVSLWVSCGVLPPSGGHDSLTHLQRAKVHLAAGDYRRAVEPCQQEVVAHPWAETSTYLTSESQALDAYADSLARADQ
jgi:hypothetical protein